MEYAIIAALIGVVALVSYLYGKSDAKAKQRERIAELVIENVKIKQDIKRALGNASSDELKRLRQKWTR
jgi:hypothetical protein